MGADLLEVTVIARAQEFGHPEAAGYLLAALSVGSAIGGFGWGYLRHGPRAATQLGVLVAIMAIGALVATLLPNLVLLGFALTLTGVVSAPARIVAYLAADDLAPSDARTEATTWVNTANNAGVALGAAAAGVIITRAGAISALAAGTAVLAATALFAFAVRGRLDEDHKVHRTRISRARGLTVERGRPRLR